MRVRSRAFDSCQTGQYTGSMELERRVTTRELLRNFRKYKELLQSGKIHVVHIKLDDDQELELSAQRGNGARIMQKIRALKRPIRITRDPELFNGFIRPLPRR